ncbi:YceD family protein [Noviherbaspirillum aridicola]|uniref:Large ribosomal RNA subunit accumulation protein YceD n=1 Tax=Noviherbaspirillum aridicola TaxID=2849687 RepID=A0ABQ4Q1T0_9BURK|nr:YceD family protein [Noviherbaspirillum aridicola]GIZ51054.1 hypothetical protein NCCP691_10680 [Noviherbaspirillum aridicola]
MNDLLIDAFEFCRLKERREGGLAVADLPRLAQESVDGEGSIRWVLQGGTGKHGHPRLELSVTADVKLICQRCLSAFTFDIDSSSVLVLAPDEKSADEIDAQLEDEDVEVIVGSHSFDVRQVIEDEALLAIPLSPRHETCTAGPAVVNAPPVPEKESPFAVLKNLKK